MPIGDVQTILGLPTTSKLRDKGLIHKTVRRRVINSFPSGGAPLTALLAWAKNESVSNTEFSWGEKIYRTPRVYARGTDPVTTTMPSTGDADDGTAIANGAVTTATNLYIKVGSVGIVAINDVLRVPQWNVNVKVTGITAGAANKEENGYLTVVPVRAFTYSDATMEIAAGDLLDYIGSANVEGGFANKGRGMRYPAVIMNQTQIFREPFTFTGSALKVEGEFDQTGPYKERALDALRDVMVGVELATIFGQRATVETPTSDGDTRDTRYMSGILEFLKLWDAGKTGLQINGSTYAPYAFKDETTDDTDPEKRYIVNADGKISLARFERWLRNINFYNNGKTSDRLCLCGSNVMLTMGVMMRAQGSYHWEVGQEMMGLKFNKLITSFGDIIFVTHPLFNEKPEYQNSALLLDIWSLTVRPMTDRDITLRKNIQANDFDGRKDEWIGELSIEFWNPMNHMFIENISEYDETVK